MTDESVAAHMRRALRLAEAHAPHPNPRVGAVVLDADGQVVGEGAHIRVGEPHAEVVALEEAGAAARAGTLITTLEPCTHHGATPPCIEAVLAAGIRRVVVGAEDPDWRMRGGGIAALAEAGVVVERWDRPDEAEEVDPGYFHHRRSGLPLVILKLAATLDGQVAARSGVSRWITSDAAREDAHRLRARADGVMVGAETLRRDDPLLSVRLEGYTGPQPRPVIVAGSAELPSAARVWARDPLVFSPIPRKLPSGELVVVPDAGGLVDPKLMAEALVDRGMLTILVEGGPSLASSLWRAGLIARGSFYLAARIAGGHGKGMFLGALDGLEELVDVTITEVRRVGPDLRVDWRR